MITTNVALALWHQISVDLGKSPHCSELQHHHSSNGSWDTYPGSFVGLLRRARRMTEEKLLWRSSFAETIKVNSIGVLFVLREQCG